VLAKQFWKLFYRVRYSLDVTSHLEKNKFSGLREVFYSDLWQKAAGNIGAELSQLGFGFSRIHRDGQSTVVKGPLVMLDEHLKVILMGNKLVTYSLLQEMGQHVPRFCHYTVQNYAKAESFMAQVGGPVVVKPSSGTGNGVGVTTWITSVADLRKASRRAACFDFDLLVEQQLTGDSYRLLYLGGECVDVVRRDSPKVTGDGKHSIRQLVDRENSRRLKEKPISALNPLSLDMDSLRHLKTQGLSPRTKPAMGEVVEVKKAVNQNCALDNHSARDRVHPDTILLGRRIVDALQLSFVGLDVICDEISQPLSTDNGYINEINTTPGIHHHYLISEPEKGIPIAENLLEHQLASPRGTMNLVAGEDQRSGTSQ
jgi:D-alanine-D-alanine ligase-like ATP-grasp enzyme